MPRAWSTGGRLGTGVQLGGQAGAGGLAGPSWGRGSTKEAGERGLLGLLPAGSTNIAAGATACMCLRVRVSLCVLARVLLGVHTRPTHYFC